MDKNTQSILGDLYFSKKKHQPSPILFDHDEKRYFPRWAVQNRVQYRAFGQSGDWQTTISKDLSCTGLCFMSHEILRMDQSLHLKIYLTDHESILVDGKISWIHDYLPPRESELGVLFTNISKKDQDLILNHAFELNPKKLSSIWFEGWS